MMDIECPLVRETSCDSGVDGASLIVSLYCSRNIFRKNGQNAATNNSAGVELGRRKTFNGIAQIRELIERWAAITGAPPPARIRAGAACFDTLEQYDKSPPSRSRGRAA